MEKSKIWQGVLCVDKSSHLGIQWIKGKLSLTYDNWAFETKVWVGILYAFTKF